MATTTEKKPEMVPAVEPVTVADLLDDIERILGSDADSDVVLSTLEGYVIGVRRGLLQIPPPE